MAWKVKAAQKDTHVILAIPCVPGEKPTSHLWSAAFQPLLWINLDGQRFCDETVAFTFPYAAQTLANQKNGVMFTIFDENVKKQLIEEGVDASLGVFVPVTTKLERLEEEAGVEAEEVTVIERERKEAEEEQAAPEESREA